MTADETIRSRPCPDCYVCGTPGEPLYQNLRDRLFDAPGEWNLKRCPNRMCGLLWLDPMPIEEDIGRAYRTYFTHYDLSADRTSLLTRIYDRAKFAYASSRIGPHYIKLPAIDRLLGFLLFLIPIYRASVDTKVNKLPKTVNGRLLEIGCGEGTTLQFFQKLGWTVDGIDTDPTAVKVARSKGLSVISGSLPEANFNPSSFEIITMFHVIEHVHDPRALLMECFRILKPGGRVIVVTPNASSLAHRMYGASCFHLDPPRHLHIFTSESLRRTANASGFQNVDVCARISGANFVFSGSHSITRTGNGLHDHQRNRALLLWARIMQTFEWIVHGFWPSIGEELQMSARKSSEM